MKAAIVDLGGMPFNVIYWMLPLTVLMKLMGSFVHGTRMGSMQCNRILAASFECCVFKK